MTILHHPDGSTLMSFAAGALPEALSAVVAAHGVLCEDCRREIATMNRLGGAVMGAAEEEPLLDTRGLTADAAPGLPEALPRAKRGQEVGATLVRVLAHDFSAVRWRRLGLGVWHMPLDLSDKSSGDLRLIKVAPGQAMPDHGHGGSELTLILNGRYTDEVGTFALGDLADLDGDVEHMPVSCPKEGCICLIASERPAKFKGLFARMVQPFIGM